MSEERGVSYRSQFDLTGKRALVVGCGGIGLACIDALAEFGASIVTADLSLDLAEQAADVRTPL